MYTVEIAELGDMVSAVTGDSVSVNSLSETSPLLGAIPEMDSLAIVNLLVAMEKKFEIQIDDDDVEQSIFLTLGALRNFVQQKVDRVNGS